MEYGAHHSLPIDPALLDLGSHNLTFTPDLASQFPHLASAILPLEGNASATLGYLPWDNNAGILGYQQGAVAGVSSSAPFFLSPPQHLQYAEPQNLPVGLVQQSHMPPHPSLNYPLYFPLLPTNQENQALRVGGHLPLDLGGKALASGVSAPVLPPGNQENAGKPVEGMIFVCNKKTKEECKRLQLFGMPSGHIYMVSRVMPGCKLFLFNYGSRNLSGVFEATCQGAMNLYPDAFKSSGSFPAQVKIKRVMKVPSISYEKLREAMPEIFYNEKKFKYELNNAQVEKLVALFAVAKEAPSK